MSDAASGKICVICGESCDDRPRVKDPKGRYFCRDCYDKALERKRRQREDGSDPDEGANTNQDDAGKSATPPRSTRDAPSGSPRAAGALGADDWDRPLTDDLDDDDDFDRSEDSGIDVMPSSAPEASSAKAESGAGAARKGAAKSSSTGGVCPNCGEDFPLAAVICVNCGYNTTTGHTVESNVGGTVVAKEDIRVDTIWPSVIGILAIVIGAGFAGLFTWGLLELMLGEGEVATVEGVVTDPTWNLIISSIVSVPLIALMLWHCFAGIGLLQRREWGYRHMQLWAKTIITIVAAVWVILAILMSIVAFMAGAVMMLIILVAISALVTAIYLAWPTFLMLWLNRDKIEAEVELWE
jgi:hypothetical protein